MAQIIDQVISYAQRYEDMQLLRVFGDQPDGLLSDPAVDAPDQPEALGGREERRRLDQATALVAHADQDFVLGRVAALQVHDRLADQDE